MKLIFICCLASLVVFAQGKSLDNDDLLRKIRLLLEERDDIGTESAETAEKRDELTEDLEEEIMSEAMNGQSLYSPANYYDTANDLVTRGGENYDSNQCMHADGSADTQSIKECSVYSHNACRKRHGTPDLVWDDALAAKAKTHAKWMADNQKMEHSVKVGENIAYRGLSTGDLFLGVAPMVKAWYNEMVDPGYDFAANAQGKAGHFTQVVWKGTQKVGCGMARVVVDGKWNKIYYCCQYSPPGNMKGQYVANVPKPKDVSKVLQSDIDKNGKCNFFSKCAKYKKACNIVGECCAETCNT